MKAHLHNAVRSAGNTYSARARAKRADLFSSLFEITDDTRILDLGGGNGEHAALVFPERHNVCVADISDADLAIASDRYGFRVARLEENQPLPFVDGEFDLIFCSSVLEHATAPKSELRSFTTTKSFRAVADEGQRRFANEIRRVGRQYFVQTPYKFFPIESHSWLPMPIVLLPRKQQIRVLDALVDHWPKSTQPDWSLLTSKRLQAMFPEADIVAEKSFGLTKSIMAVRSDKAPAL